MDDRARITLACLDLAGATGDTDSDMRSGRRADASIVGGVLTGAHERGRVLQAGATHLLDSVADLPALILRATGPVA